MIHDLQENDVHWVKQIIKKFETYPSIVEIKKSIDILEKKYSTQDATVSDINTLLKSVNSKKTTTTEPNNIIS